MDWTKVVVAGIAAVAVLVVAVLGFQFISEHWEDIKALGLVALVLGGTVTIGGGGLWLSGRKGG